jgi:hypothetical protein
VAILNLDKTILNAAVPAIRRDLAAGFEPTRYRLDVGERCSLSARGETTEEEYRQLVSGGRGTDEQG